MVSRPYLLTPQSKMSEAARNVDHLCNEYLTEMSAVATIAALAVKKHGEVSSSKAEGGDINGRDAEQPREILPDFREIPEDPRERLLYFIGLLNLEAAIHVAEDAEGL